MNAQTLASEPLKIADGGAAFADTDSIPRVPDFTDKDANVAAPDFKARTETARHPEAETPNQLPAPDHSGFSIAVHPHAEPCLLHCPWNGTSMCVQLLVDAEARIDRRVSLGVLYGLKQLYYPHHLPACIQGNHIDWSGSLTPDIAGSGGRYALGSAP